MSIFVSLDQQSLEKFDKNARLTGIVMIVIGIIGIIFPRVLSFTLNLFISTIFLMSAMVLAYSAYASNAKALIIWLKPLLLLVLSLLILFNPAIVISTLGIILVIYFLMDGIASIVLAIKMRIVRGWFFMLLNGLLSLLLGFIMLVGWPFSSVWMVGLLVGISFVFDGIALLALAGNTSLS